MGYGSKLNISIKNDRIVALEKRTAVIESILNERFDSSIRSSGELTKTINGLLKNEIAWIKDAQELIYEELMARTVGGRWKRLKKFLAGSSNLKNKGDKT